MKRYFAGLSQNTFLLAFASLFSDISTEMLYPVLPIFLTQTLGASGSIVGVVEGIAQGLQNVIQGASGWLSDKLRRRKPIALAGYIVAALSKPLIGLSTSWPGVLGARSLDRLAAGWRSAPRDGLVAASATPESRGKAFGLEGIGDNLGAFLGPLIAVAVLVWFAIDIRSIFLLSVIPGLLAAAMILAVREERDEDSAKTTVDLRDGRFPVSYWKYLLVTATFGIGNSSNSFLILRTKDLGASLPTTIVVYAFFNLVAALASYPAGYLSDRWGRKNVLRFSFLIFFAVYAGFGMSVNVVLIGVLFVLYGIFQGTFRAVGKALATDFVPPALRASGVGWYSATIGLSGLVASVVAGQLWTRIEPSAAFLYGAATSLLGIVALQLLVAPRNWHGRKTVPYRE